VPSAKLHRLPAVVLLAIAPMSLFAQMQRVFSTGARSTLDRPVPHPLSWWTKDPLRLDEGGMLTIGDSAGNGKTITARDYRVKQEVTPLGTIAGRRIVQVMTTIHPGPRIIFFGWANEGEDPIEWKSLLVQDGIGDRYVEIYKLQSNGTYPPFRSAAIYGVGPESILGTFDPGIGNGGSCSEGYWWFDKAGAHAVDFSPLEKAIQGVLPRNSTYFSSCSALDPKKAELQSWVQKAGAECHACGGLGTVYAQYKIQEGVAMPVSVRFEPENQE